MREKITVIKRKALKRGIQEYYDHYTVATELYNQVLYDHQFEGIEMVLTYHMNLMNDLKKTFNILEPIEENINLIGLENYLFKTRSERLALDNYYALQDLRKLYKEVEQQYYTLKTATLMDDDHDTD